MVFCGLCHENLSSHLVDLAIPLPEPVAVTWSWVLARSGTRGTGGSEWFLKGRQVLAPLQRAGGELAEAMTVPFPSDVSVGGGVGPI